MLPEMDGERLMHIRDAAHNIADFTAGLSEEIFREIRGMRNRLAHAYMI